MKLIAIGDIHGRNTWKRIVRREKDADKIIFIGDYFDTRDGITAAQQIFNFKNIIRLKQQFPDKVKLLFGNHDFHYLRGITEKYSGYQQLHAADISEQLHLALDKNLLQMSYELGEFLFTHAGVTKTWFNKLLNSDLPGLKDINASISEHLNETFQFHPQLFQFTPGESHDIYGDEHTQSPIWVRPRSLVEDSIDEFIQIVGHTQRDMLTITNNFAFIDTLGTSGEYLEINEYGMNIKN